MPPIIEPPADPPGPAPDADPLFEAFRAAHSSQEMLALAAAAPDDALDALEQAVETRLARAGGDEAAALAERLASLRGLRAEHAGEIGQLRDAARQWADLPEEERLLEAFAAAAGSADIMRLVAGTPDDDLDGLEAAAAAKLAGVAADEREAWQARLDDLRRWRAAEQDARRTLAPLGDDAGQTLTDRLVAWIQTPDWDASQAYLREHAGELLTAAAAAAMMLLRMNNAGHEQVELHANLLAACRERGADAAYEQLRRELAQQKWLEKFQRSQLGQAVIEFVQAGDDTAAALLASRDLLTTADARDALESLRAVARGQGDDEAAERIGARLGQWEQAWRQRVGGPLRRAVAAEERQPESVQPWRERLERQPLAGERGALYTVVTANNSAIGDNAQVLNIYNVGDLLLAWGHPRETKPDLAAIAVGRAVELDELHRRLQGGDVALVGVRGLAGVGKTVLAAMYATRYGDQYPGGVIWATVGPQVRQPNDITPLLQRLAAYAYSRDLRVTWLDQIVFAPDAVQMLLGGHGRLLLVCDDVWSDEVATVLRAVAPPGSAVLLTTRDRRVAYALGGPEAIQELDVLSAADARALLQRRAPGLPGELADRVAERLGRHAQALALAGTALHLRKAHRYAATADELLDRVARGVGFGDLPDLDRADKETSVEIALKYTYDYLGEDRQHGSQRQACLRSLGAFAQEASFDAEAAASLWQMPATAAKDLLLLFDHLALVQETAEGGRWQQHAILRAYARSLQNADERLNWLQRHADHYLQLAQASIPANTDRVAQEFAQIEHAFAWCQHHSPGRATRLANIVSQVMFIRGRAMQAGEWLRISMDAADQTGDRTGKANTLKSLGDLESRLGNVDAARRHYDASLHLYRLEQEPGGIINTMVARARLEIGAGNVDQALPFYEEAFRVADQSGFANHPIVEEMRKEYEALRGLADARNDPLALALAALLRVEDDAGLAQALADHPILAQADALFALAGLVNQALAAGQNEVVARQVMFLVVLLEQYNHAHGEQIEAAQHEAVIGLYEQAIPLAGQIDADLAAGLRQQAGWAYNALGNHYADADKDLEQAVAAYTRGLGFDPANAMLLRNRAGVHLDRRDPAAAQADIEAAAALDPDAPRLARLRAQWEEMSRSAPGDAP